MRDECPASWHRDDLIVLWACAISGLAAFITAILTGNAI